MPREAINAVLNNHDMLYVAAILDYADWLTGKTPAHPRYQFFHPQTMESAATPK